MSYIDILPREIWMQEIFTKYLDDTDHINVRQVCKKFNKWSSNTLIIKHDTRKFSIYKLLEAYCRHNKILYLQNLLHIYNNRFANNTKRVLRMCLIGACKGGHYELAQKILAKGEIDHPDIALAGACRYGHYELAQLIKNCNYNNTCSDLDCDLDYGLYKACKGGHRNLVQLIIDMGADDWNFGLFGACKGGNLDIIRDMIDKGAVDWNTGLKGAFLNGDKEIIEMMLNKGAYDFNYSLCKTFKKGDINVINLLLAKIKETGYKCDWEAALQGACLGGHLELAKMVEEINLIECGYKLRWDNYPFYGACAKGHYKIVEYILNNYNVLLHNGLMYACINGQYDIVKLLLSKKGNLIIGENADTNVDVNVDTNIDMNMALNEACKNGFIDIVELLILEGATYCDYCENKYHNICKK